MIDRREEAIIDTELDAGQPRTTSSEEV